MATKHGSGAVLWLDNYSGSLTNLSAYCDTADLSKSADTAEDTAFSTAARAAKGYLPGLKDGSISAGGPWDPALDRHMWLIKGRTVTYEIGPEGGDSSDIKYTGEAVVTEFSVSAPVGDKISWSATLQPTGGITRSAY